MDGFNGKGATIVSRDPAVASSSNGKQFAQVSKSWQDRAAASSEYNPVIQSSTNGPERLVATGSSDTQLEKLPAADLQVELARLHQISAEMDDKLRRKRQLLAEGQSAVQYFSVNSGELEHNIAQLREKLDRESQRIRDTLWGYVVCNCREFSAIPSVAHEQHYRVGQVVAIGDRAQICHCTKVKDSGGSDAIVLKSFDKSNLTLQELQKIANEIRCLRRLQHPNIIELLDVVHWTSQIGLIMSHAGQTLFELSSTRGVGFKHCEVLQVLRGVVPAVAYAHDNCVCHRDLKPENILIKTNFDGEFDIKLIDLGLAAILPAGNPRLSGFCGTPGFIAPELIVNPASYNGYAVDMWAVGCIVLELLVGRNVAEEMWMPIYDESVCEDAQQFMSQLRPALSAVAAYGSQPDKCPSSCPELTSLMMSLLCVDPVKRLDGALALKSPFFALTTDKPTCLVLKPRVRRLSDDSKSRVRRLSDDSKSRGPRLSDASKLRGPRLSDDSKSRGPRLSDDSKSRGPRLSDDSKSRGPRLSDDSKSRGPRLSDDSIPRGPRLSDDSISRGPRLSDGSNSSPQHADEPPTQSAKPSQTRSTPSLPLRPTTTGFQRVDGPAQQPHYPHAERRKKDPPIRSMVSMPSKLPSMANKPRARQLPSLGSLASQPRPQMPFSRKPPTHPFHHPVQRKQSLPHRPATTNSKGGGHFRFPSRGRPPPPKQKASRHRPRSSDQRPQSSVTVRTTTRKHFFPSNP